MGQKGISRAVIRRLPRYYRYLDELRSEGIERISSHELSNKMNITASQIRQDLNNFGGFGQQGYGYNVEYLFHEIGKILGLNKKNTIVVIGGGNMGQALTKHGKFRTVGFDIIGVFDNDPEVIGKMVDGIPIQPVEEAEEFIRRNQVKIAALTVPKEEALELAQRLKQAGIRAFWNFAQLDLQLGDDVIVENVHLSEGLMRLSYRLSRLEEGDETL